MASNYYYSTYSPQSINRAAYFTLNTPPHINAAFSSLTDLLEQREKDAAFQMQQQQQNHYLKYPTPPNTPPKLATLSLIQQHQHHNHQQKQQQQPYRQSVIMKTTQGCSPKNVIMETLEDDVKCVQQEATSSDGSFLSTEYICDWINCGRYFESLELMAAHVTQLHAVASLADGLYYCRWRGCTRSERGFNARYKMLVHVRTHTKEKPHQCHLCEKSFSRAENLKIHIRSHSGEKPYVCTFEGCDKAYSNSSDRFKHTRTHSMEKPYVCKIIGCQKRYTDPSSLRKHVKTFKHAEQLIDETAVTAITSTTSTAGERRGVNKETECVTKLNQRSLYMAQQQQQQQQLQTPICMCMTTAAAHAPQSQFYMNMSRNMDIRDVNMAVCQIKANRFTAADSTASYWIVNDDTANVVVDAVDYSKNFRLHEKVTTLKDDFDVDVMDVDVEVETPLDLSIKRS